MNKLDDIQVDDGYNKFRGRCKELSELACIEDKTLTLVRGYYYCPIWNVEEPHWWCVKQDGVIFDPSKDQFPSKGLGLYKEFNGIVNCSECGKELKEEDARFDSRYAFCSLSCNMRFVGL